VGRTTKIYRRAKTSQKGGRKKGFCNEIPVTKTRKSIKGKGGQFHQRENPKGTKGKTTTPSQAIDNVSKEENGMEHGEGGIDPRKTLLHASGPIMKDSGGAQTTQKKVIKKRKPGRDCQVLWKAKPLQARKERELQKKTERTEAKQRFPLKVHTSKPDGGTAMGKVNG